MLLLLLVGCVSVELDFWCRVKAGTGFGMVDLQDDSKNAFVRAPGVANGSTSRRGPKRGDGSGETSTLIAWEGSVCNGDGVRGIPLMLVGGGDAVRNDRRGDFSRGLGFGIPSQRLRWRFEASKRCEMADMGPLWSASEPDLPGWLVAFEYAPLENKEESAGATTGYRTHDAASKVYLTLSTRQGRQNTQTRRVEDRSQ